MFEKEAEERAKDYTENKERQIAYGCGFLDGADFAYNKCSEKLDYAKTIIQDLLNNSDEYARQRAMGFFGGGKNGTEICKADKESDKC